MELSINANHFCKRRDGEPRSLAFVLERLSAAGFRRIDYLTDFGETENAPELLAKYGMTVNQSHCPFNRYAGKDYSEFSKDIMTAAKNAHALGSPLLVVHGDEFDFENGEYSFTAALEFNYRLFYPVVDYASANGMTVAFENLFPDCDKPRFCSTPEEIIAIVDRFSSKNVGVCLDTGHAHVADKENYLGNISMYADRVVSTHIHDNFGSDSHMFPYTGKIDLEECVRMLKRSGYDGDITYEFVYDRIPDAALSSVFDYLYSAGKVLMNV